MTVRPEQSGFLRSGELAKRAGVSPDTLRHYERLGLLPAPRRTANGYRAYSPDALDRVRLIQSALALGFTLDELARILKVRDRGGLPCRQVQALAEAKLAGVEAQLHDLATLRDELRRLLAEWGGRLDESPDGRAGLLETLPALPPRAGLKPIRQRSRKKHE